MYILGIESSCDDTSVALLDCSDQGHFVVSEKTASQIEVHKKYGGVVPEIAGRMHAEKIVPLIEEVLKDNPKPDAIVVTSGPGLITGLLVGTTAAKTLSLATDTPLVSMNHIDGHIHSVEIQPNHADGARPTFAFPAICLVVSGGHTELVLMRDHGDFQILGRTKDDAAGECFDKVAKLLGYEYPGGPWISKLGVDGKNDAIAFPRPMIKEPNFDFSFSGLKTAALYWLQANQLTDALTVNDFCASFEQAIVDTLVAKTLRAMAEYSPASVVLAGGVSANRKLRGALEAAVKERGAEFLMALPQYCMDNGAMIAVAGYYKAMKKQFTPWNEIQVNPQWRVDK